MRIAPIVLLLSFLSSAALQAMEPSKVIAGYTPHKFIENNDKAGLEEALKSLNVNAYYTATLNDKFTLLHYAASLCNKEMMTFLIKGKNADPYVESFDQEPPLIMLVKKALRAEKNLLASSTFMEKKMWENIYNTCLTSITHLVDLGVSLDAVNRANESPLFLAVIENSDALVMALLNLGANPNGPTKYKPESPMLHLAVEKANKAIIEALLQKIKPEQIHIRGRRGCVLNYAPNEEIKALLRQYGAIEGSAIDLSLFHSGT